MEKAFYRNRNITAAILSILIGFAGALFIAEGGSEAEKVQQGIAGQLIRFHVLANSDSEEDQRLKRQVRDELVVYMEGFLKNAQGLRETRKELLAHRDGIKKTAENVLLREGSSYPVKVTLGDYAFPEKVYGDCTFPAGTYEALRVEIGEAGGHNWWCVLYPNLCFLNSGRLVVPDEQKEQLRHMLTEREYEEITDEAPVKISFKFLDFLNP